MNTEELLSKIGKFELCEIDYKQVMLWADQLDLNPEYFLMILENTKCRLKEVSFSIIRGHIKTLTWDFDMLPLNQFELLEGMELHTMRFRKSCPDGVLHLNIPTMVELDCAGTRLYELHIATAPLLTNLKCAWNRLRNL